MTGIADRRDGPPPSGLSDPLRTIGSMAVGNVLIDSAFKAPLVAVAALWALAVVLHWRGR